MRLLLPLPMLIAPLLLVGGCTVGPDHARPAINGTAAPWIAPTNGDPFDLAWWRALDDPLLTELIETAAARNLDVRAAEATLREARANRAAVAGSALPQLTAKGSATRNQISENGQLPIADIPGFDRRYTLYDAGFDASWEIDLWGANRRAREAADARGDAAEAARRAIVLATIAEVARTYGDLRGAQARLASATINADARDGIARLTGQRQSAGEASLLELTRAETAARSAHGRVAPLEADVRAAAYRIALLTGQPPEALLQRLLPPAPLPPPRGAIGIGLRSELLQRRPDILRAERELAAATADIGVATADLFPRVSLLGTLGQQARSIGSLDSGGSTRFGIGPQLHWPIFAGGQIRARIRAADARADAAAIRYEQAVLGALSDSETAINRYAAARASRVQADAALAQSDTALRLARQRYDAGEDGLIAFLDTQSAHSAAEQAAIDARVAEFSALVALNKALGGGFAESARQPG